MFGRRDVRNQPTARRGCPRAPKPRRVSTVAPERLEARRLLCGGALADAGLSFWVGDAAPAHNTGATAATAAARPLAAPAGRAPLDAGAGDVAPNGLPLLNSLPGAPTAIYLDFDGYVGEFSEKLPYDTDDDPSTFSAGEQADIREAWRHVASYFAIFNTNVTTVQPSVPHNYALVTNSREGSGYSFGSFPSDTPTSYNPAGDVRTRRTGIAHEIGHNFGLQHQSDYDLFGDKTREYASGYDRLHGPLMGIDYAQDVHKWFIGHPGDSAGLLQDDVAVIAGKISAIAGGDGMRRDDYNTSVARPRPLPGTGGTFAASGVIERLNDVDAFSFASPGGPVRIDVAPPDPVMLDAKLELYTRGGTLIAAADAPANDQHLDIPHLPSGTYVAVVMSHGDYGDLGMYDLTIKTQTGTPMGQAYNALPAPRNVRLGRTDGTGLTVAWDEVPGAEGYALDRSVDGVAWAPVRTTSGPASTSVTDESLDGGRRYFYRVAAVDGAGRSAPSTVAHAVTRPSAVASLSVTSWQPDKLVLNWRDVSGETGYRIERLVDVAAGTWAAIGTVGANVPSFIAAGLTPSTGYQFRVVATGPFGESLAAEAAGTTRLPGVGALTLTVREPHRLALRWDSVPGATGYRVQRSRNNYDFSDVATLPAGATNYEDGTVQPLREYYYRVVATNPVALGLKGEPVFTATPAAPAQAPPAPWAGRDVGDVTAPGASGAGATGHDNGTFTLVAGGDGMGGEADAFRYTYRPLVGDGEIVARVATQEYTSPRDMAGVTIREHLGAGARHASMLLTSNGGTFFQYRAAPSAETEAGYRPEGYAPFWVRLVRTGNTIIGYRSADGAKWVEQARATFRMNRVAYVGLAVSSGVRTELATVTFSNVGVSTGAATGSAVAGAAHVRVACCSPRRGSQYLLGRDDGFFNPGQIL